MEHTVRDAIDMRLLSDWQRDLPLVSRPFSVLAKKLGVTESEILSRLKDLTKSGAVSRVGGVVRPNLIGASTLAAVSVPALDVDEAAAVIGQEAGVNHLYLRENKVNLWFVVTGPHRDHVRATLARIENQLGRRVLDLNLECSYHIDLGFPLDNSGTKYCETADAQATSAAFDVQPGDSQLVQALTRGLEIEEHPFQSLAVRLGQSECDVLLRLDQLCKAKVVKRIGIIVRHRALGWRSNAMVVWDIGDHLVDRVGTVMATRPSITLCYRRKRVMPDWPYNLYCMVHAKARSDALDVIAATNEISELNRCPRKILFSTRCFKQTGAMLVSPLEAA